MTVPLLTEMRYVLLFRGCCRRNGGRILPVITGVAFAIAEAMLLQDESNHFCWGIR